MNKQFKAYNILDSTQTNSWKVCEVTTPGGGNTERYFLLLMKNYLMLFSETKIIQEISYSQDSFLISNSDCSLVFLHDSSTVSKLDITEKTNSNNFDIAWIAFFAALDNTNSILRVLLFK